MNQSTTSTSGQRSGDDCAACEENKTPTLWWEILGFKYGEKRIISMDMHIYVTKKLKGGTYIKLHLRLLQLLMYKIKITNVFLWSLLTALHPAKNNVSHINSYIKFENEIKIDKFPVLINDITKIERVNNLKINLFEF
jgi:hypothetical protein